MNQRHSSLLPYALLAPSVLYLLGMTLYPFVYLVWQSLYVPTLMSRGMGQWVGLENYSRLLGDGMFWYSIWNTLVISGSALLIEFVIAMGLALLVANSEWVTPWRIIFLLPMLFMPSAVGFMWKLAFFPGGSVINDLLLRLGLVNGTLDWFGDVALARWSLIVADAWEWTPYLFLIFLAGLMAQSDTLREASTLNGANWLQHIWYISLPLLRPVIAVGLVLRGIDLIRMFTKVFVMTKGSPAGATETISYYIYRVGFRLREMGYASAMSVVLLVANLIIAQIVISRYFQPKW